MKNLIFIIVIFACGLNQCKKSEHISSTASDENLVRSTEDVDTSKNIVKGIFSGNTTSANPMKVNPDDSAALIFIRMFYKEYLLGFENDFADSVMRKYCTSELIEKLANKKLDYDPFLNAQDFDDNLLKTLDIKKADDQNGYYVISYIDGYSKKNVYIIISLVEFDDGYKINDVTNDVELRNRK